MIIKPPYRWEYKPPLGSEIGDDSSYAQGMIASYLLNEGVGVPGSTWPQLPALAQIGGVVWTPGKDGWALSFDGTTGYYSAPTPTLYNPGPTGMTVAALVYPLSGSSTTIFSRSRNAYSGSGFDLSTSTVGTLDSSFALHNGSGTLVPANQWSVIVGRGSITANETSWWSNGVKGATVGTCPNFVSLGGGQANIGAAGNGAGKTLFFNGLIGWLIAWNVPLTDSQIQRLSYDYYPYVLPPVSHRLISFASATSATIAPSGISSVESWGSASIGASATIAPSGIASAESWGSTVVSTSAAATIAPTSIGSSEAWGVPVLGASASIAPTGIGSAESWGSVALATSQGAIIAPIGIGSAETWGVPSVGASSVIAPTGISSAESWGSVVVTNNGVSTYAPTLLVATVTAFPLASDPAWTTVTNL